MLDIRHLYFRRGDKSLFEDASLSVYPGAKVGLIGKNGSGKSTLFALICGQLSIDQGDIQIPKHWTIASVQQETPSTDISAKEYVLQADQQLVNLQAALKQAEFENNGLEIAKIHEQLDHIDAYNAQARTGKLLSGLGFSENEQHRSVKTFSGGWRMRLNLAQALIQRSDLLLLDEPTNHLDLETVLWLEDYLCKIKTTLLVISHDCDFLNRVTRQTIELSDQKLTLYGGNYDFYQEEKARRLEQQQASYQKQSNKIKHLQSFITRFKAKATKAKQAQSRIKALNKMEKIAPAHWDVPWSFDFFQPDEVPDPLIQTHEATIGYLPENPIVNSIVLTIHAGARYGLLGVNGSGKSTLIKVLTGALKPLSGDVIHAEKLRIGYFAQHQLDTLRADQSPVWHLQKLSPDVREQDLRNFLGGFGFSGQSAVEPIAPLSGGEKARLALALLIWQKPNLLLLDEPTNHLDLSMRHALALALQSFEGALLLVSHDRTLLETVCDEFLLINNHQLLHFDGDLNDYRAFCRQNDDVIEAPKLSSDRKREKQLEAQLRQKISKETKPYQNIIAQCEAKITQLSAQKIAIESFLSSDDAYNDSSSSDLRQQIEQLGQITQELQDVENHWLDAHEKIEEIRRHITLETP